MTMKLVTFMGGVWRLSGRKYQALLRTISNGQSFNLNEYGTYVGDIHKNVTDLGPWEAQEELNELTARAAS